MKFWITLTLLATTTRAAPLLKGIGLDFGLGGKFGAGLGPAQTEIELGGMAHAGGYPTHHLMLMHPPMAHGPGAHAPITPYGPVAQAPMPQAPMAQGPMAQGPMAQGPMAQGPMPHAPMVQGPMAHAPMVQDPMAHAPGNNLGYDQGNNPGQ